MTGAGDYFVDAPPFEIPLGARIAAADDVAGQPSPDRAVPEDPAGLGIDPALLGKLGTLLNDSPPGGGSQQAVLRAMLPALKPRRREKLERAMRLAKLARLAKGGLQF